jgi:hypothetical protein
MNDVIPLEQRNYTVKEAAKILAISVAHLYSLMDQGAVKYIHYSISATKKRTRRISYGELYRLLHNGVSTITHAEA